MDPSRFDGLARGLAGFATRRGALAGLLAGLALPLLGDVADARKQQRNSRRKRHKHGHGHERNHRADEHLPDHAVAAEKKKKKKKCKGGAVKCGKLCVAAATDRANCGACGRTCAAGESCQNGACTCGAAGTCGGGQTCCNGVCRDLQQAPDHCGACGHACGGGETCSSGVCVCGADTCSGNEACCAGVCAVTASDLANCGACGQSCSTVSADTCVDGECACGGGSACGNGDTCCAGDCADLRRSPTHCGQCGRTCRTTESCCASDCVDISSDRNNCGACDTACDPEAADICSGGACLCGASPPCAGGLICCAGVCRDLQSDPRNCGACNETCPGIGAPGALAACEAEACTFVCQGNRWDVDGDPANGCEAVNTHTGFSTGTAVDFGVPGCGSLVTFQGTMYADAREHDPAPPGFNPATRSVPQWYRVRSRGQVLGLPCQIPPRLELTMGGVTGCYRIRAITADDPQATAPVVNGVATLPLLSSLLVGQVLHFGIEKSCLTPIHEAVPYQLRVFM